VPAVLVAPEVLLVPAPAVVVPPLLTGPPVVPPVPPVPALIRVPVPPLFSPSTLSLEHAAALLRTINTPSDKPTMVRMQAPVPF
jgi:hypothetical protein